MAGSAGEDSGEKEGYVQKIEGQLKDWGGRIESLKTGAESSTARVKAKCLEQAEELRKKQETARKRLQQIKEAGGKGPSGRPIGERGGGAGRGPGGGAALCTSPPRARRSWSVCCTLHPTCKYW